MTLEKTPTRSVRNGLVIRNMTRVPAAAACDVNGRMPSSRLRQIGPGGHLESSRVAFAWSALVVAMAADGYREQIGTTYTPGGTYRSLELQERGFYQRWRPAPISEFTGRPISEGTLRVAFYAGAWWELPAGISDIAVPGTSWHGRALAIDAATGPDPANAISLGAPVVVNGKQTTALAWLRAPAPEPYQSDPAVWWVGAAITNAESFGFSWENPRELWHLRYFAGNDVPQRVLEVLRFIGAEVPS